MVTNGAAVDADIQQAQESLHHGVVLLEAVAADAKVGNLEVLWGRGGIISCSYLL